MTKSLKGGDSKSAGKLKEDKEDSESIATDDPQNMPPVNNRRSKTLIKFLKSSPPEETLRVKIF